MKSKTIKPSPVPMRFPGLDLRSGKSGPGSLSAIAERLLIFVVAGLTGGLICAAVNDGQLSLENYLYAQVSEPINQMVFVTAEKPIEPDLQLDAKAAFSARIGANGRDKAIIRKNITDVLPIASLTKLMTATVVLENPGLYDPARQVVVSQIAANQDDVPMFGNLIANETYSVRQLLNLMLFYSSNDAAYALSEVMGTDEFVAAMNRKAGDLGLGNTEFHNPSGLDMDGGSTNRSSAGDLMVLVKYILEAHEDLLPITLRPAGPYLTENGIFGLKLWDGQSLIGGKTGYTGKAGGCMISVIEDANQRRYVNILLGSTSPETRVVEMQKIINFVNNNDNK